MTCITCSLGRSRSLALASHKRTRLLSPLAKRVSLSISSQLSNQGLNHSNLSSLQAAPARHRSNLFRSLEWLGTPQIRRSFHQWLTPALWRFRPILIQDSNVDMMTFRLMVATYVNQVSMAYSRASMINPPAPARPSKFKAISSSSALRILLSTNNKSGTPQKSKKQSFKDSHQCRRCFRVYCSSNELHVDTLPAPIQSSDVFVLPTAITASETSPTSEESPNPLGTELAWTSSFRFCGRSLSISINTPIDDIIEAL